MCLWPNQKVARQESSSFNSPAMRKTVSGAHVLRGHSASTDVMCGTGTRPSLVSSARPVLGECPCLLWQVGSTIAYYGRCAAFCPPGLLCTGAADGEIICWSLQSGTIKLRLRPPRGPRTDEEGGDRRRSGGDRRRYGVDSRLLEETQASVEALTLFVTPAEPTAPPPLPDEPTRRPPSHLPPLPPSPSSTLPSSLTAARTAAGGAPGRGGGGVSQTVHTILLAGGADGTLSGYGGHGRTQSALPTPCTVPRCTAEL